MPFERFSSKINSLNLFRVARAAKESIKTAMLKVMSDRPTRSVWTASYCLATFLRQNLLTMKRTNVFVTFVTALKFLRFDFGKIV